MSAAFHLASRASTRAAESYRMVGQAQVQISREFDFFWLGVGLLILPVSRGMVFSGDLTGF